MEYAKSKHTVFIADDHEIVRIGLKYCISLESSFEVVGEASNGLEAFKKIKLLEPEVAILDIFMPQIDGIELANKLSFLDNPQKTILFTACEESFDTNQILESQANGCLSKEICSSDLILSLNKVLEGNYVYSKAFFAFINNGHKAQIETTKNAIVCLTNLQKTIITQRLKGRGMSEIAHDMNLSPFEITNHINALIEMNYFIEGSKIYFL